MKFVKVKLVGDAVIVKSSNNNYSLFKTEVNRLRLSKKLDVVHNALVVSHDYHYAVLVPKNLSEEDAIDVLAYAIEIVDKEEQTDDQQTNIKCLINSYAKLIRLYQKDFNKL